MMKSRDLTNYLYLGSRILCSPLEALFTLLIFIMTKELGASVWQLTLLACAKPAVSLFAFYASSFINGRLDRIRPYLFVLNCLGGIPPLFFLFIDNNLFYIFSYALLMATQRATFPAWNEMLKEKAGLNQISSIISKGTSINYFMTICVPLLCSFWMDLDKEIWKTLFFFLAVLQLLNTIMISNLKLTTVQQLSPPVLPGFKTIVFSPWIKGVKLLMERPDFAKYLLMFFLGGIGLVAIQPFIPIFFNEGLHLSYKELTLAFSLCKGVSFLLTSRLWARWSQKISLYKLNCYINLFSCLFIIFLVSSSGNTLWLYFAYLMYGTMQAGCELSWNISGPIFSKEKESTAYSGLNLALVGLRGCICPVLAQLFFNHTNAIDVFIYAGILCFISLLYGFWLDRKYSPLTRFNTVQV